RIMYIHVPAAYIAVLCYAIMAITSACYLIFRYALADICARCCAQIGACFTVLCLITGSLWGKPMWGTWWVWDARLTSVLVLFFIYCGYIALAQNLKAQHNQKQLLAILAIIGAINLPIIKFSVDWWNTLHQPASLLRADGPSLHRDFLVPLLWMLAGFSCLFFWQLLVAVENTILGQKLQQMRMRWIEE
ncbi:MAG: heme ABC transporter permease CcmC, partial [Pseudomonadota bacterium]